MAMLATSPADVGYVDDYSPLDDDELEAWAPAIHQFQRPPGAFTPDYSLTSAMQPVGHIQSSSDQELTLVWCVFKETDVPVATSSLPCSHLFQRCVYFSTPVKFTRWLFKKRRGKGVVPWALLVVGWREAKPCMSALKAAMHDDTEHLRPDARRPKLRAKDGRDEEPAAIAVRAVVVMAESDQQESRALKWSTSDECSGMETHVVASDQALETVVNRLCAGFEGAANLAGVSPPPEIQPLPVGRPSDTGAGGGDSLDHDVDDWGPRPQQRGMARAAMGARSPLAEAAEEAATAATAAAVAARAAITAASALGGTAVGLDRASYFDPVGSPLPAPQRRWSWGNSPSSAPLSTMLAPPGTFEVGSEPRRNSSGPTCERPSRDSRPRWDRLQTQVEAHGRSLAQTEMLSEYEARRRSLTTDERLLPMKVVVDGLPSELSIVSPVVPR